MLNHTTGTRQFLKFWDFNNLALASNLINEGLGRPPSLSFAYSLYFGTQTHKPSQAMTMLVDQLYIDILICVTKLFLIKELILTALQPSSSFSISFLLSIFFNEGVVG